MRSISVLSSTRYLKVVVYFGENRFVSFSSICSVMKVSHYKYFEKKTEIHVFQCNISFVRY